jgi:gas vesicle protein
MKKIVQKFIPATLVLLATHFILPGMVPAQEDEKAPDQIEKVIEQRPPGWDQGVKQGWGESDVPPGLRRKAEELRRLRKENPEEYRRLVHKRKEHLRKRLQRLRREDPEKFENIMSKRRERISNRLERMRDENPERFKEIISKRRELLHQRLERIKKDDPQRYERIMKRRELRRDADFKGLREKPNRHMKPSGRSHGQKKHGGRK